MKLVTLGGCNDTVTDDVVVHCAVQIKGPSINLKHDGFVLINVYIEEKNKPIERYKG